MVNVAIIGTGSVADKHVEGYLVFPKQCRIKALVNPTLDRARQLASRYNLDVDIYESHAEMLSRGDIDLVSICTPPHTHAEITIDCLKGGSHVLLEKPMAPSLAECDAMQEAAERSGRYLSIVAQKRFLTPMMKLKNILDRGIIGTLLHTQVDSYWWRGLAYYDMWWRGTWQMEGGGPTINHAVHHIDLLQWMAGMPEQIRAVMANMAHTNSEVEDLSIAILQYPKGGLGQITCSVVHHGENQRLVFQGDKAEISSPWQVRASAPRENGFPVRDQAMEQKIQAIYDDLPSLEYQGHTGQIHNVLSAILDGKPPLVTGLDGRNTIELITGIYKAAATDRRVTLPLSVDDPFYTTEGKDRAVEHFYEKRTSIRHFNDSEITIGSSYQPDDDPDRRQS